MARGRVEAHAPTISIRAAIASDVDQIVAIERGSFGDPWSPGSFRSLVDNAHVHFAVALAEGRVVGYVVAWFVFEEAEIANLAVAPSARGRRIGATLLDAALDAATRHGVARVFLEVRDSNTRARALYGSRGFEEVGRRRGYYRKPIEDAVVMRREIGEAAATPRR
jgi:ribosomal-protein-alanine N-acetyltransferase